MVRRGLYNQTHHTSSSSFSLYICMQKSFCFFGFKDLKDYMRQAGEVTYADAHKEHKNEGWGFFLSFDQVLSWLLSSVIKEYLEIFYCVKFKNMEAVANHHSFVNKLPFVWQNCGICLLLWHEECRKQIGWNRNQWEEDQTGRRQTKTQQQTQKVLSKLRSNI